MTVVTENKDGVLIVTADHPPVNALGYAVRVGLWDAIGHAAADPAVTAVVIRCDGRTFFAGADITEFGKPPQGLLLPELVDAIEACPKPVVAAIHGTALGGGLEIALGCHHRVAVRSARLGLPEVKLGLLPGAGGTQRLPRLIGLEAAIPMIAGGEPVSAERALAMGLIDRLVDDDALDAEALALARSVDGAGDPPRVRDRVLTGDVAAIDAYAAANRRRIQGLDAPRLILEAVRAAAELPFAEGIAVERAGFRTLMAGPQSKALRHYFFAERAAARIADLPADVQPLPIRSVGILGAGTMGGGIAMNFLSAGIPVTLVEREQGPLDAGVARIRSNYDASARRGRFTPAQVDAAMALLTPALAMDAMADCDLVIEAVFELMDVKQAVFAELDRVMKPGAVLASNTSYLDIDQIAAATGRPEWVVGVHFFSPANVMKLLEVVRGPRTAPVVLATAMALAKRIGKVAVVAGSCFGFIGNRMLRARQNQAAALSEEGAVPARIDQVLLDFGFPMGPFQMNDLAGLDIGWDPRDTAGRTVRERLCEAGLRGQKNGRGYYDYDADRNRTPSAQAMRIIRDFAAEHGIVQRDPDAQEMLERLLYPMVNEGALILEEGIAQRASDINVVWVNGYGWPPQRGGPMFWAEQIGLTEVVAGLKRHSDRLGKDFRISTLLMDKADSGQPFDR
ncbi:MAG TPA: 3-hydroxyacyl-CoA dehydrogenase NAD-binding domain-containing protein [Sphingomonas sp.]|jgi:3-hydroxyacyl-CoA dehydrogenase|uniref:3-hydroxyacyl-CoA dehydrogenase NAD-binding domain-containing protein n=1 Tax=Sphingomonas sp. TaxID=28214 RepID=UPI002ED94EDF